MSSNDMWIKAVQIEFPERGGKVYADCALNFVINDSKNRQRCAYRFHSHGRYNTDANDARLNIVRFLQANADPWDKFRAWFVRKADGYATRSAQLYSQRTRDVKGDHGGRLHSMRLLLWIDPAGADEIEFFLRYPEPLESFAVTGEVRRLGGV